MLKSLQNVSADNKNTQRFVKCALRVNACEVSVYMVRTFMKCMHVCAPQKAYLTLYQIINFIINFISDLLVGFEHNSTSWAMVFLNSNS